MSFLNKEEYLSVLEGVNLQRISPIVVIDSYVKDIGKIYNFQDVYAQLVNPRSNDMFATMQSQQTAQQLLDVAYNKSKEYFDEKFGVINMVLDFKNTVDIKYRKQLLSRIPQGGYSYID